MSMAYRLTPWTHVARPHADITGGSLDMGTYAVNLARVFRGGKGVPEVYATPDRFFAATYFTERLRELLADVFSGLAGGTKALVFQLASLTDVHWTMSGEVVLMTLLGGLGTVFGPVVGAFVMVTLEQYLAQLGSWVTIVQGVIFVICVLTFRRGIVGELARILRKPL